MDNMWRYWSSKYDVLNAFENCYKDKCKDEVALAAYKQAKVGLYALEKRMIELASDCGDGE